MKRILILIATVSVMVLGTVILSAWLKKSVDKEIAEQETFEPEPAPTEEERDNKNSIYDTLTDEQRKYLTDVLGMTKKVIDLMDYEMINYHLLGTGFELYNQTSGLEIFGTTYKEETAISDVSESNDLITLPEATEIRLKGTDIRLDDFVNYKYEIVKREDSEAYVMELPLEEYENTYIHIVFTRNGDSITMKAPFVIYDNGESNWTFSILYDQKIIETFFNEEPKYTVEGKVCMDIQYGSVTENSLVIYWNNWTENEYKICGEYDLYEVSEGKEVMIDTSEKLETVVNSKAGAGVSSTIDIIFADDVKLVDGNTYILKYGKDEEGYLYEEITFCK